MDAYFSNDSTPALSSSDELFFYDSYITSNVPLDVDVKKQIIYGFYGLCWHHKLEPVTGNKFLISDGSSAYATDDRNDFLKMLPRFQSYHNDKEKVECSYEWKAQMNFPKYAIENVAKSFKERGYYHGTALTEYLVKGIGQSEIQAMLDCVSRYALAYSRNRKRFNDFVLHHDDGLFQAELEEPYVANMIEYRTLDELELALSCKGFSEKSIPICIDEILFRAF